MEQVVLVDDNNQEIGTADKATVHTANTPLHRGFSLFLFNSQKELLLTQRALTKKTFPGIWTNTVCGHPAPGETPVDAAKRRLREELGIIVQEVKEVAPYRYRFADQNGIVENEICPVLMACSDQNPDPHIHEVEAWKWIGWEEFLIEINEHPQKYSPWCREEVKLVRKIYD